MKQFQADMAEATRLTRSGQLAEATALIQRTLRGAGAPDAAAEPAGDVVAGEYWVDDSPQTSQPAEPRPHPVIALPGPVAEPSRQHARAPAAPPEQVTRTGSVAGQFLTGSYANAAGERSYKLYIPNSYQGQALPLVVMLHGCTQNPDDFAAGTRMNTLADEHSYAVVYPAQASSANRSACWNWFRAADQRRDQGEASLIAGITRQVSGDYHIDSRRVYVAGLSAGGAMAVVMALIYPELYAAVACHSGLGYGLAHDLPSALAAMRGGKAASVQPRLNGLQLRDCPLILFHGDRDNTVHPSNADRLVAQWMALHAASAANTAPNAKPRVAVREGRAAAGQAYTCAVYHDAGGRALVERWLIHGAGHAWSGGSPAGSFTNPAGPDAAREILRFFAI